MHDAAELAGRVELLEAHRAAGELAGEAEQHSRRKARAPGRGVEARVQQFEPLGGRPEGQGEEGVVLGGQLGTVGQPGAARSGNGLALAVEQHRVGRRARREPAFGQVAEHEQAKRQAAQLLRREDRHAVAAHAGRRGRLDQRQRAPRHGGEGTTRAAIVDQTDVGKLGQSSQHRIVGRHAAQAASGVEEQGGSLAPAAGAHQAAPQAAQAADELAQ